MVSNVFTPSTTGINHAHSSVVVIRVHAAEKIKKTKKKIRAKCILKLANMFWFYLPARSLYNSKYSVKSESHPLNGITFLPFTLENSSTSFLSTTSEPNEMASAK